MTREKTASTAAAPKKSSARAKATDGGVKKSKKPYSGGKKPKLSKYNLFMKSELANVKSKNPGMKHQDAFKIAAKNWKTSAENPINIESKA